MAKHREFDPQSEGAHNTRNDNLSGTGCKVIRQKIIEKEEEDVHDQETF